MYTKAEAKQREREWNKKYGSMTRGEREAEVKAGISKKFDEARARAEQKQAERDAKYNLPYGGLVKALGKAEKQIKDLENKPAELRNAMKEKLNKEFDSLVENGLFSQSGRDLWISEKLVNYMHDTNGEYRKAEK